MYVCIQSVSKKCIHTFTGAVYLNLLQNSVMPSIREVFKDDENFCFQQDGAPPYYHHNVRAYLDEHLPNRWIARRGSIEYHPRSPDLAPMNFFLCGHLKDNVVQNRQLSMR